MIKIPFRQNRIPNQLDDHQDDLGRFYIGTLHNHAEMQGDTRQIEKYGENRREATNTGRNGPAKGRPALGYRLILLAKWAAAIFIGLLAVVLLLIVLLRWAPVPTSAFILRQKLHGTATEYRWLDGNKISPNIAIAVVASEDQRFPHHRGFDFEAISEALKENRRRSRPRGASTISQQVAKNLFLWPGRSFLRKGLEAGFTIAIEVCWPKKRILEIYLNIAQFGPETYGVAAASRRYFHKTPDSLTPHEAALLAAVLPNPENYGLAPPSPYVWQRAADIEEQVRLLGGPDYLADMD